MINFINRSQTTSTCAGALMKMRSLSKVIASIGVTTLAISAYAQSNQPAEAPQPPPTPTGLSQAVERAITTHPEINARYQDFVSSLEGKNIARAGWRPQVTAQAWIGKEWRSNISNAPSYDWNRPGWNLELRQLIFDGGATSGRIQQFGFEKLSKYYDLLATSNSLASEAAGAYLDVQRYRAMAQLANDNFTMHQTTLGQLQERQKSGVGRGVDMEQASGRLSLAQTNLMTESNNLNDVTQRYRRIVGDYPAATMQDAPDVSAKLPVPGTVKDFSDSLRINPTILSKQALVQASQAGVDVAKAAHAPILDLRASTGRDREQPGDAYKDVQASRVQLMLTYPLYRGGADEARIRQTAAQTYAAQDVRDYTCRNVQQELSVTWNNIIRLRQQLPFLREHELSTSKVRVAYQQQYQIGQRSLLDLLDTENELFDARRALLNAEYDLKKAEYQWLTWSSQVLPALGLTTPHNDSQPEEHNDLVLPDDIVAACQTNVPDTNNLSPLVAVTK
jgi:outer membrane protein, adhesin transport system